MDINVNNDDRSELEKLCKETFDEAFSEKMKPPCKEVLNLKRQNKELQNKNTNLFMELMVNKEELEIDKKLLKKLLKSKKTNNCTKITLFAAGVIVGLGVLLFR